MVKVLHDGCVVSPLFADCVHTRYWDSLFFIGINFECLHFILFERHVQLALALIEHRLTKEMIGAKIVDNFEADRIKYYLYVYPGIKTGNVYTNGSSSLEKWFWITSR